MRFQEGDLVLRRVLYNKKALDSSWKVPYKITGTSSRGVSMTQNSIL